jgi:hypothetical protein
MFASACPITFMSILTISPMTVYFVNLCFRRQLARVVLHRSRCDQYVCLSLLALPLVLVSPLLSTNMYGMCHIRPTLLAPESISARIRFELQPEYSVLFVHATQSYVAQTIFRYVMPWVGNQRGKIIFYVRQCMTQGNSVPLFMLKMQCSNPQNHCIWEFCPLYGILTN